MNTQKLPRAPKVSPAQLAAHLGRLEQKVDRLLTLLDPQALSKETEYEAALDAANQGNPKLLTAYLERYGGPPRRDGFQAQRVAG